MLLTEFDGDPFEIDLLVVVVAGGRGLGSRCESLDTPSVVVGRRALRRDARFPLDFVFEHLGLGFVVDCGPWTGEGLAAFG